ncbi:MAG: hypothetical protein QOG72_3431 [Sphingomonadales bacterium]|nr:hypothetical protein [Sphingomonadales bacterium]
MMANGRKRRLGLMGAAGVGALLLAAGSPAHAQEGCPRQDADRVDQGYRFTFDSVERQLPAGRRQIVYCVVNTHARRPVFVDWPDADLKGWVRAGRRGSAVRTGPATRAIAHRNGLLWFGSRPRQRPVSTAIFATGPVPGGAFARGWRGAPYRFALQAAPAAGAESWTSSGRIDVPIASVVEPFLARLKPKRAGAGQQPLSRAIFRLLVRYLETRPEALVSFEMNFTTEAPAGASALRYGWSYRAGAPVLLRFNDPALQRAMFGRDAPFAAGFTRGPPAVMQSPSIEAAAGVQPRTGRLDILLLDGVTVIGSIGFDYLAPAVG